EGEALGEHHHLEVVEQLADLFGGLVEGLVLAGHPHFCGLLDDLLADMVHARVELADGARSVGTNPGPLGEFGEQRLEILHPLGRRAAASGAGRGRLAGWRCSPAHSRPAVGSRCAVSTVTRAWGSSARRLRTRHHMKKPAKVNMP